MRGGGTGDMGEEMRRRRRHIGGGEGKIVRSLYGSQSF